MFQQFVVGASTVELLQLPYKVGYNTTKPFWKVRYRMGCILGSVASLFSDFGFSQGVVLERLRCLLRIYRGGETVV